MCRDTRYHTQLHSQLVKIHYHQIVRDQCDDPNTNNITINLVQYNIAKQIYRLSKRIKQMLRNS